MAKKELSPFELACNGQRYRRSYLFIEQYVGIFTACLLDRLADLHHHYFSHDDWFYQQYRKLAKEFNVSEKTIERSLKELKKCHFIDIRKDKLNRNQYKINYEFIERVNHKRKGRPDKKSPDKLSGHIRIH
jgi:hypothetical protein